MKRKVNTAKAPQAIGPYSQAVVSDKFVFISGQIHLNAEGTLMGGTIEDKTNQVMRNISEILVAAGLDFANVIKTTIYLVDLSNFKKVNQVYSGYFREPYPARETVGVKELPLGADLEISMIAAKK